jgi:hypothetical protein
MPALARTARQRALGPAGPGQAEGTEAERALAFQEAYGALRNRIQAFVALPLDALDALSLQHAVDEIGAMDDERRHDRLCAVNGLGRIGKLALKPLLERGARSPGSTMPWAIRRCMRICWSSTRSMAAGRRSSPMTRQRDIDGTRLPFIGTRILAELPLDGVDVVIDCTGVFKTEAALAPYFEAGVKKVVVSRR